MGVPFLSWSSVDPLQVVAFDVEAPPLRGHAMSGTDDGFTNEQLTELALMQAETSAQTGKA